MSCGKYDYIIVGAGTAASTLIRFLSDDFSKSVLVLEKGSDHRTDPLVNSVGYGLSEGRASTLTYDKNYSQNCNCPDPFNAKIEGNFVKYQPFAMGVGSGGSSQINYALSVRGTDVLYDQWANILGDPLILSRWSAANLLPIQIGLEKYTGLSDHLDERGFCGELNITNTSTFIPAVGDPLVLKQKLAETLTTDVNDLDPVPIVEDYNVTGGEISVSLFQSNIEPGFSFTRSYGFKEYLGDGILDDQGNGEGGRQLKVKFNTTVLKVIIRNGRAVGVKYIDSDGSTKIARSKRKVILCASVFSSTILQYSGIGDPTVLEPLGIEVVVNNPHVGKNLQNHYGVTYAMTAKKDPENPENDHTLNELTPIIGFYNYDQGDERTMQIILQHNAGLPEDVIPPKDSNGEIIPYIGGNIWNLKPTAKGTANIVNPNPITFPNILYNYFQPNDIENPDLGVSIKAYKTAKRLADNLGETMLWPLPDAFVGDNEDEIDQKLASYARADLDNAVTFHCSGTCRMSQDATTGVVDKDLNVHRVQDLMVADTSIAPIIIDGNTGTPAYYIGAVAAKILGSTTVPEFNNSCANGVKSKARQVKQDQKPVVVKAVQKNTKVVPTKKDCGCNKK